MVIFLLRSTFDDCPSVELDSASNARPVQQRTSFSQLRGKMANCLRFSVTQMLMTPSLIVMTITATRTHRSLVDYASGFPDVYDTLNLLHFLSYSTRTISFQG
jgi:hypothetical protein